MFTAYFDASGSPDHEVVMVVSGFVSTDERWLEFETEWRESLSKFGVRWFHMKEFAHSVGEYENWKGDQGKRIVFIKRLIDTIKKHTMISISVALPMKVYREFNRTYELRESNFVPYTMCAGTCVEKTYQWLRKQGIDDQVSFIFENGEKDKGLFMKWMDKRGYSSLCFKSKDFVALQAADLIAWEHQKLVVVADKRGRIPIDEIRRSLFALTEMNYDWGYIADKDLLGLVTKNKVASRNPSPTPRP